MAGSPGEMARPIVSGLRLLDWLSKGLTKSISACWTCRGADICNMRGLTSLLRLRLQESLSLSKLERCSVNSLRRFRQHSITTRPSREAAPTPTAIPTIWPVSSLCC